MAIVDVNGNALQTDSQTKSVDLIQLTLSLHSSNESNELSQWLRETRAPQTLIWSDINAVVVVNYYYMFRPIVRVRCSAVYMVQRRSTFANQSPMSRRGVISDLLVDDC